ncbi:hypothetical protein SEA_ADNAMA_37 [Mycobacterium phage Adnama]|uniref:hypothetical protein n=1 Tax=Mycobacterium phage Phaux TaxID=1327937 RepID=UPI000332B57E|nr:hypothetical protein M039_gp033 [Mycobacterium phage Phaux]YP_008857521.1 hypothetical protein PHATBACTER_34 [Mycobacterium phage PhatBacter]YP_008858762.1 hypothetical protein HUFFLYPUFF_33 [Mycobacterium phage HufflyPuff]ATN89130.1 hypothetical protein SEA_FIRERED_34 [Mycobacterium phage FireRed]ATN91068.1 hypothetical protein SEA_MURICA_33 [Mycobacterium phage Murica]AXC35880.1 hypothetical protein SEA_ADNAMA_37 [Mycobacterium phage Adnama]AXH50571.1 hypothetical protein SEA_SIMPLIPHY_3
MSSPDELKAIDLGVELNGDPQPWRFVKVRHNREIGDIVTDPARGEWNSDHNGKHYEGTTAQAEHIVGIAEQIAWTHIFSDGVKRDAGDVLIALGEFLVAAGIFDAPKGAEEK